MLLDKVLVLVELSCHLIDQFRKIAFKFADEFEWDVALLVSKLFVQFVDFNLHLASGLLCLPKS